MLAVLPNCLTSVADEWDDDEEWAEESQQTSEIEQQLSNATLSSNTSDKSHEERLEIFFNFVEVNIFTRVT